MSDSTLISLFSTAPSRACSYNFSTVLTCSIYKYPNKLSLQHCCAIFCILYEPIFHICLLCVAHSPFSHKIYAGGFNLSYWCGTSYNLSWLPAPEWHTTMLLFQPLDNHCHVFSLSTFSIISLMNCLCIRFSLHFFFSSFAFCFLNSALVIYSLLYWFPQLSKPLL